MTTPDPTVRVRALNEAGQWVESDRPEERIPKHRRFVLHYEEQIVAEGITFSDNTVALRWRGELPSTTIFGNVEDVIAVHPSTTLNWLD